MPFDDKVRDARGNFSSTEPGQPVKSCGGGGDPSYTVDTVPADLAADERGVYGYMPVPGSEFSASPPWPDWSDPQQVAAARAVRLDYHQGLADEGAWVAAQREAGRSEEAIARELVDIRNKTRMSKYSAEELPMLFERNQAKYKNPYGPSYEDLLKKYKTNEGVINAGTRSNPTMDILTGIATVKGH
jgi:hypothetical protein